MAVASLECPVRRMSWLLFGRGQVPAGWQSCRESSPAKWMMGRFQERAARTREFEGPSQQCSSQIPLRCLPATVCEIQASCQLTGECVQAVRPEILKSAAADCRNPGCGPRLFQWLARSHQETSISPRLRRDETPTDTNLGSPTQNPPVRSQNIQERS